MQRGMGELAVSGERGWGGTRDLLENVLYQNKMEMLSLTFIVNKTIIKVVSQFAQIYINYFSKCL